MSQTITDLQEVVKKQGELIASEHEEVQGILEEQAEAIKALEEQLANIGVADAAVKEQIALIEGHNEAISNIVTAEVEPTPPVDPNAPVIDNSLPGQQPVVDNTLPGDLTKPGPK